jgi:endonuclease/exonuclease/phosphatase family metal-dependent hydrolase
VRRLHRLLGPFVLVVAVLLAHRLWRALSEPAPDGPDTSRDRLAVVSWNLHNFPGEHDRARMRARIDAVAPHVLAVQEIRDPAALSQLVPGRTVALSERGGSGGQSLGLVLDDRVELRGGLVEHRALEIGGRVRPAVSAYLRTADAALDLHVVVVHLKAMPDGHATRRLQWAALADVVARLPWSGPGTGDHDILLLGDFNATGPEGGDAADERADLAVVLGAVGLRPIAIEGECSAYWDGTRHDAWLEPALLDLAFVGGALAGEEIVATPLGACARAGCAPLRSTAAYPDAEIVGMSDHCPVLVRLR